MLLPQCCCWLQQCRGPSDKEESTERLQKSAEVLQALMSAPDKGVPEEVVDNAKCILVVPHLVKGGFIVGAKHGRGLPPAVPRRAGARRHLSP